LSVFLKSVLFFGVPKCPFFARLVSCIPQF
jgi:hypothetical protein